MRKYLLISLIIGWFAFSGNIKGQEPYVSDDPDLENQQEQNEPATQEDETTEIEIVEITYPEYEPWEVATIDGKLKMKGLPLSPSMKIFMQKDSLLDISLRAPFFGEVGKLHMTSDTLLIVNKMDKSYSQIGLPKTQGGVVLDMLQEMFLARFFLPGINVSEVDLDDFTEITYNGEEIFVEPKNEAIVEGVRYAYAIDKNFNPLLLLVLAEGRDDLELDVSYEYTSQGYNIDLKAFFGSKMLNPVLELKRPEWKGESPKDIDLRKFTEKGINTLGFGL